MRINLIKNTKKCTKCNEIKDLGEFHLRSDTGKYRGSCKGCWAKRCKKYNKDNKERISKANRERYLKDIETNKATRKKYRLENTEKIRVQKQRYRNNNKENIAKQNKKYRDNNKECLIEKNKIYYRQNKPRILARNYTYQKHRKQNNIQYRLSCILRTRLNNAIRGKVKAGSAVRDLGCSIEYFREHLESKFVENMTWENYGSKWHIDHILPLASFDLTDREQLLKACHYTNLQPLWVKDHYIKTAFDVKNLKKSSKIS